MHMTTTLLQNKHTKHSTWVLQIALTAIGTCGVESQHHKFQAQFFRASCRCIYTNLTYNSRAFIL